MTPRRARPSAPMPPARVLLLEDDLPLREMLGEFLAEEGVAVTVCTSLREVLAAVGRHPGAVVVADGWAPRDHLTLSAPLMDVDAMRVAADDEPGATRLPVDW